MTTLQQRARPAKTRLDPAFLRLALVMMTGVLAVVFDTTIVNIALDTLGRDLHAPVSTIQWVTTGYLLALGMAVPVTGFLVDRFGGKNVWLFALALFLVGSIGASLAVDAPSLIALRVVQGIGGGLLLPVMQTLLVQAAGGRSLGSVTAVIALPVLIGPILGPVIGGLIVAHASWRWIFWVNVPFCVAGLILAWRLMPAGVRNRAASLDVPGLALLSPGIAALIYGLSRVGTSNGFGTLQVLVPLIAGSVLLVAFVVRALLARDRALVDIGLFRVPSFGAASALMFLSGFALYGAMLLVPLYFQQVRAATPFEAGILLAPQGIGVMLSRGAAGRLTDRLGSRWVAFTGLVIVGLATLPFARVGASTNEWWLVAALVLRGVGLGAVTIPVMTSAYEGLERGQIPHASIITRTAQQIGGSFGTAVLAVILDRELTAHSGDEAQAFDRAFWWSVGFTVLATVIALGLPSRSRRAVRPEPPPDRRTPASGPPDRPAR